MVLTVIAIMISKLTTGIFVNAVVLCWSLITSSENCDSISLVSREEWGSKYPVPQDNISDPVHYVFIHHSAGRECSTEENCAAIVRGIQKYHVQDRGWNDIGYSFLIGGDGRVYVGRGWGVVGAHTYKYNDIAYGICLLGNFMDHVPSDNMIQAAKKLIACGLQQGYITPTYGLYGHRDGRCTECPGDSFYSTLDTWDQWHAKGSITKYC